MINRSQTVIDDLRSDEAFKSAKPDTKWIEFVKEETRKEVDNLLQQERFVELVEPIGFLIDRLCVENIKVFVFETKIRELGQIESLTEKQKDEIIMFVNLSRQANDNRVAYKNAITKKFKEIKEGKDKGLIETRTYNG